MWPLHRSTDHLSQGLHPFPVLMPCTFDILHDHAEVALGLKRAEHADHKGVLCKGQDVTLHKGLLDLVAQDEVLLVNLLHGKTLAGLFVPHQIHSSEKAGSRGDVVSKRHFLGIAGPLPPPPTGKFRIQKQGGIRSQSNWTLAGGPQSLNSQNASQPPKWNDDSWTY